jgi:hypothetical protein
LLGDEPSTKPRARSRERKEKDVRIGLRQILLIAAVVLFVVAALSTSNSIDILAYGLACLAGALVIEELGLGKGRFGRRR